jgi:hypothetical protein
MDYNPCWRSYDLLGAVSSRTTRPKLDHNIKAGATFSEQETWRVAIQAVLRPVGQFFSVSLLLNWNTAPTVELPAP